MTAEERTDLATHDMVIEGWRGRVAAAKQQMEECQYALHRAIKSRETFIIKLANPDYRENGSPRVLRASS